MHIARTNEVVSNAFWWKTYSPPIWLLNGKNENLTTTDLMGMPSDEMLAKVQEVLPPCRTRKLPSIDRGATYLIAPRSANIQKSYPNDTGREEVTMYEVWSHRKHLNLDDMDFANDGFWKTMGRVVGDRGLVIWRVTKNCWSSEAPDI
jgi:phosphatidylinositol glycan class Z